MKKVAIIFLLIPLFTSCIIDATGRGTEFAIPSWLQNSNWRCMSHTGCSLSATRNNLIYYYFTDVYPASDLRRYYQYVEEDYPSQGSYDQYAIRAWYYDYGIMVYKNQYVNRISDNMIDYYIDIPAGREVHRMIRY